MNKAAFRFAKGSGVYTCQSCKRSTRATGRNDNEFVRVCAECYDLQGIDNSFCDGNGTDYELEHARAMLRDCQAKGGKIAETDFEYIPF